MPGKFELRPFSQIDITDPFFDTLKKDYPEFESSWFPKCVAENRTALVFSDENGLGAFIALKQENEDIIMQEGTIPARPRIKVSTLRLAERFRGQRLGEGALGLILWDWQRSRLDEIYVTVYPHHSDLMAQLYRFGFTVVGHNHRGEIIYIRNRNHIDYSDPYKSFPFLNPSFRKGGYLIVNDEYHDTLFPYSELKNTMQEQLNKDVANGISKVYIGQQWSPHYQKGEPIFIYRRYTGGRGARFKSCLTSYCVVTDVIAVKRNGRRCLSLDQLLRAAGNKSFFSTEELTKKYAEDRNLTVIQMLYCGYFGIGNNVNLDWLDNNGFWTSSGYPTDIRLTPHQCQAILLAGGIDTTNI